jgi:hypothetical protein
MGALCNEIAENEGAALPDNEMSQYQDFIGSAFNESCDEFEEEIYVP